MSYAGPTTGSRASSRSSAAKASRSATPAERGSARRGASRAPRAAPPEDRGKWQQLAIFGVGLALGIAVGAGAALLAAPQSGAETRAALRARAGRLGRTTARRGRTAWDDLREEIRGATRTLRRRRAEGREERALAELEREAAIDG